MLLNLCKSIVNHNMMKKIKYKLHKKHLKLWFVRLLFQLDRVYGMLKITMGSILKIQTKY